MKSYQLRQTLLMLGDKVLSFKAEICLLIAVLSVFYMIFQLFEIQVIIAFIIFALALFSSLQIYWSNLRKKGIINLANPKLKKTLLERSFMDIYKDLVYFPTVTKIVGAFLHGAVTKPDPKQMHQVFSDLDKGFVKAINTKGILHLAPSKIEKLILEDDEGQLVPLQIQNGVQEQILKQKEQSQPENGALQVLPQNYGKVALKWDRIDEYEKSQVRVHEVSMHGAVLERVSDRIKWRHIVILCGMLGYALMKTKGKKMGKIFLYNGSAIGVIIVSLLIYIKYSKSTKQRRNHSIFDDIEIFSPHNRH